MKRRLKLTPFAKIVFVLIIIAGARYVYVHQNKIYEGHFFNFRDSINFNIPESKSKIKIESDTIILYISENDSLIHIKIKNKNIHILKSASGLNADTVFLKLSEKEDITIKIIAE